VALIEYNEFCYIRRRSEIPTSAIKRLYASLPVSQAAVLVILCLRALQNEKRMFAIFAVSFSGCNRELNSPGRLAKLPLHRTDFFLSRFHCTNLPNYAREQRCQRIYTSVLSGRSTSDCTIRHVQERLNASECSP
jgi:hypothetical protein